ncbi:MAG: FkbM family methyltransferase [Thaumarchaeota archaeon]|nr:FkbM family methyltransferase [Nitrososphaerota archaeon]
MRLPRPESAFQRLLLDTKYIRFLGRRMFPTYTSRLDDGTRLMLRTSGEEGSIVEEIFEKRIYEKYFRPEAGQTVVDGGAQIGCFTLRSARLVGGRGKVLSFEPFSGNYARLKRNVELNNLGNTKTFNFALGDSDAEADIWLGRNPGSHTLLRERWKDIATRGSEKVRLRKLDSVMEELGDLRVDFVKLDTEGSELPILKGAARTLDKYHPRIVGEAHPTFSSPGKEIIDFLRGFGYDGRVEGYYTNELFYAWEKETGA